MEEGNTVFNGGHYMSNICAKVSWLPVCYSVQQSDCFKVLSHLFPTFCNTILSCSLRYRSTCCHDTAVFFQLFIKTLNKFANESDDSHVRSSKNKESKGKTTEICRRLAGAASRDGYQCQPINRSHCLHWCKNKFTQQNFWCFSLI